MKSCGICGKPVSVGVVVHKECLPGAKERLDKFYFTFGTNPQFPYRGGWVEVYAEDPAGAIAKFRTRFPDVHPGIINCAFYYTAEKFEKTEMFTGIWGDRCHEVIE